MNAVNPDRSDRGNESILGTDDLIADPKFVDVTKTTWQSPLMDDFKLKGDSPAIGKGKWTPLTLLTDIDGKPRPLTSPPDAGAFQH